MKILVVGGTGVIGKSLVELLEQDNEVIAVGNSSGDITVDIESKESIQSLFEKVGMVDAIVCTTGKGEMGSLEDMPDSGYETVLNNKLMGQVNLVRIGMVYLNQGGSITLTSGESGTKAMMPGTAAIAMACGAINSFVAGAALEFKNDQRINVVSPGWVKETMEMLGMDSATGITAKDVATYYKASIASQSNGKVFHAVSSKPE